MPGISLLKSEVIQKFPNGISFGYRHKKTVAVKLINSGYP